jgi:hypothetical protein
MAKFRIPGEKRVPIDVGNLITVAGRLCQLGQLQSSLLRNLITDKSNGEVGKIKIGNRSLGY